MEGFEPKTLIGNGDEAPNKLIGVDMALVADVEDVEDVVGESADLFGVRLSKSNSIFKKSIKNKLDSGISIPIYCALCRNLLF